MGFLQQRTTLVSWLHSGPQLFLYGSFVISVLHFTFQWCIFLQDGSSPLSFMYLEIICVFFLSRFISWIPRYGMLYSPPSLEVYMVHSVALERLGEHPFGDINIYINYDLPQVLLDLCINCLVAVSEVSSLNISSLLF